MNTIYFDNNATTPVPPEVRRAMLDCLEKNFGNPSSNHRFGESARHALDLAREQTASLINAPASRIIFTSGGSEANNMALMSAVSAHPEKKHLITSAVEHDSVLKPMRWLEMRGYELTLLPVRPDGSLDLATLSSAIRPDTAMVSLMAANNETGVIWPIDEISRICREKNVLYHCDAVQCAGKEVLDMGESPVNYLTMTGHKLHSAKGIGALYAQRGTPVIPLILGAGQEQGLRAGTENVAGAVGFGLACEMAVPKLLENRTKLRAMRDHLEQGITVAIPDARINGQGQPRLANTVNVSFKHTASGALIQELDDRGIAVSAHAACHSGDLNPSHVLTAMGVEEEYLHGTLRISLSRYNTMAEIDHFLAILPELVTRSRHGFAK